MYLGQDKIRVFPSTRRTYGSAFARQVTEANLVEMINNLVDVDSFVVTKLVGGEDGTTTDFSFCIHGYNFTANLGSMVDSFKSDVYATITIDTTSDYPEFYELSGLDVNNNYEGVNFTDSVQTGTNEYCLHILTHESNGWVVPEESQLKFSIDSLGIDLIDGGII